MQPDHRGQGDRGTSRGPRGYSRSDARILEDVCEALIADRDIDPRFMRVTVDDGVVILAGRVRSRDDKRDAEYLVEAMRGVRGIDNRLKVSPETFEKALDPELEQGIFGALIDDHRTVSALFDTLLSRREGAEERTPRLATISRELLAHAHAEQEVFYAALEDVADVAAEVRRSRVEHSLVEHLLGELEAILDTSPEWIARVEVLEELVQHHVQNEETKFFPRALAALDPERSEELAERFARAKEAHLAKLEEGNRTRPPARTRSKSSTAAETSRVSPGDDPSRTARR